jgi:hypothetical protein
MQNTFIEVLRSSPDERRALYAAAAARLQTRAENVEKDLYVCWILDFLFNRRAGDPVHLYFKGGTSLSKAYDVIKRFSEDIDIGVYKADIDAPLEDEIAAQTSVTKQQKMLAEKVDEAARAYISGPLRDQLLKETTEIETAIGEEGHFTLGYGYDAYRKRDALDILVVTYRSVFGTDADYVQPAVRIEGGARPDPVPVEARTIIPYIASELDSGDDLMVKRVTTVKPERTFWEKVLILHAMTEMTESRADQRNPDKLVPDLNRYSRHYYDVHQLWTNGAYGKEAASMTKLAEACRAHKELMFRAPDHRYDRAVPGGYRLVPTPEMRDRLSRDYERMSAMIFGEIPKFEDVMTSIAELEEFVNSGT